MVTLDSKDFVLEGRNFAVNEQDPIRIDCALDLSPFVYLNFHVFHDLKELVLVCTDLLEENSLALLTESVCQMLGELH